MWPFRTVGAVREPYSLALFPLKTVLFPGGLLPLKVFEQRYIDMTKACLKDNLTAAQRSRLKQVVADPTNVGVFASSFSGGDNAEACDYYNFHVYRHDGTLIELTFNFTD